MANTIKIMKISSVTNKNSCANHLWTLTLLSTPNMTQVLPWSTWAKMRTMNSQKCWNQKSLNLHSVDTPRYMIAFFHS